MFIAQVSGAIAPEAPRGWTYPVSGWLPNHDHSTPAVTPRSCIYPTALGIRLLTNRVLGELGQLSNRSFLV